MIGLGSNRLSVCRRGGMSVTQAGRGGMEWLLGGRGALGASPYSAQATAALLAQFPTQWPTIRDYGFAHPEIVGYMNAYVPEDAKIAYSLVEGIGTRWIQGNQSAYFDSGWTPKESNFEIQARFIYTALSGTSMALYANSWGDGTNGLVFMYGAYKGYVQTATNVKRNVDLKVTAGADVVLSHKLSEIKTTIAGVDTTSTTGMTAINNTQSVLICGKRNGADLFFGGKLFYWRLLFGTEVQKYFIPYEKSDHRRGMIDLISGTFYGDATGNNGFTISETPAS